VHVDDPRLDRVLVAPDGAEDPLPREHLAGVRRQVGEEIELGVREHDVPIGTGHPSLRRVDDQVAKDQAPVGRLVLAALLLCPAQMRSDPGHQLSRPERFGDVVVGSDLQSEDDVDLVVLCAEDDHRHPMARPADLAAHVKPREVRQDEIEHDHIGVKDLEAG
jgi:hypothetical protein